MNPYVKPISLIATSLIKITSMACCMCDCVIARLKCKMFCFFIRTKKRTKKPNITENLIIQINWNLQARDSERSSKEDSPIRNLISAFYDSPKNRHSLFLGTNISRERISPCVFYDSFILRAFFTFLFVMSLSKIPPRAPRQLSHIQRKK